MKQVEDKCYELVSPVSIPQTSSSFTIPLLDLRTNPFQEEMNDKSIGNIDRVIENIIKLKEQFDKDELGFSKRLFVALKLEQNQLERKPI